MKAESKLDQVLSAEGCEKKADNFAKVHAVSYLGAWGGLMAGAYGLLSAANIGDVKFAYGLGFIALSAALFGTAYYSLFEMGKYSEESIKKHNENRSTARRY